MVVLVLISRLMRHVLQKIHLHQLLDLDLELEPAKRIGRHRQVLPPPEVDQQRSHQRPQHNEENDEEEGERQDQHEEEEDSGCKCQLLLLDVSKVEGGEVLLLGDPQDVELNLLIAGNIVAFLAIGRRGVVLAVDLLIAALLLQRRLANVHLCLHILRNYLEQKEAAYRFRNGTNGPILLAIDGDLLIAIIHCVLVADVDIFCEHLGEVKVIGWKFVDFSVWEGAEVVEENLVHFPLSEERLVVVAIIGVDKFVEVGIIGSI